MTTKTYEQLRKSLSNAKGQLTKATKAWENALDSGDTQKAADYCIKIENYQLKIDEINIDIKAFEEEAPEVKETKKPKAKAKTTKKSKAKKVAAQPKKETEKIVEVKADVVEDKVDVVDATNEKDDIEMLPKSEASLTSLSEQLKSDAIVPEEVVEDTTEEEEIPKTSKNTIKGRWPQHSYRVEIERHDLMKLHAKGELPNGLEAFKSLADMSRSLNDADYFGHIHFWIRRSMEQYNRFINAAKKDFNKLSDVEQDMVRGQFYYHKAFTDSQKKAFVTKLENLLQYMEDLKFNEVADEYQKKVIADDAAKRLESKRTKEADRAAG